MVLDVVTTDRDCGAIGERWSFTVSGFDERPSELVVTVDGTTTALPVLAAEPG